MAETATPQEINRFVQSVDEFFSNYAKLITPNMRAQVYATGNAAVIADYESAITQGAVLKSTIEATTGAWAAAKAAYSAVTGVTSTFIGDAIDEIRSWFGYKPAGEYLGGLGCPGPAPGLGAVGYLGVVQLPAAAWVAGILGAVYLANQAMNKVFIFVAANQIQASDPSISRSQALAAAADTIKGEGIIGAITLPLVAAALLAAFLIFGRKT